MGTTGWQVAKSKVSDWAGDHETTGISGTDGPTSEKDNLPNFFKVKVTGRPSNPVCPTLQSSEYYSSRLFPYRHPPPSAVLFIFTRALHSNTCTLKGNFVSL